MFPPKIHYHILRSYCAKFNQNIRKVEEKIHSCLKQKQFKQYSVAKITKDEFGTDESEFLTGNDSMVLMKFKYASKKINVYEETLMFDDTSLVGFLGGSLGLFVGFSFFGYAMPIVEAISDKMADFFQKLRK